MSLCEDGMWLCGREGRALHVRGQLRVQGHLPVHRRLHLRRDRDEVRCRPGDCNAAPVAAS